jgi:hypothetical protein
MVELLDPQGTYFAGRIIAQGINAPPGEEPAPDVQFKRLMQVGAGSRDVWGLLNWGGWLLASAGISWRCEGMHVPSRVMCMRQRTTCSNIQQRQRLCPCCRPRHCSN